MELTEEQKRQKDREVIVRVKGNEWSAEEIENVVDFFSKRRTMSHEEWQDLMEEKNRITEQADYEMYCKCPTREFYTEEEFDGLTDIALEKYEWARKNIKDNWHLSTLSGCMEDEWTMAAYYVNPGEWYRAFHCHYPQLTLHHGHTPQYWHKEKYFVSKALACGYAKTAEEAVEYFKENK